MNDAKRDTGAIMEDSHEDVDDCTARLSGASWNGPVRYALRKLELGGSDIS